MSLEKYNAININNSNRANIYCARWPFICFSMNSYKYTRR